MPDTWKITTITMIPKKFFKSRDTGDYRPISLLSCLSKVAELLIRNDLYKFFEVCNMFQKQQSGFRNDRGTSDNLLFFTQKVSESINKKKSHVLFFYVTSQRPLIKSGTLA